MNAVVNMWDRSAESMSREPLRELQFQRLKATLQRVANNVPCYQEKFRLVGFQPGDFDSLEDLQKLPFTSKDDLRLNYPYGMFAVPLRDVLRIHSSSGTTGKPTVVGYTASDMHIWAHLVARFMTAAGVTAEDVIQVAFGYGLFTGAFGLDYGAEAIGAAVIPMSAGNTEKQIMVMRDFGSSVLACTPSYALTIADHLEEKGIRPARLSLKIGLFGGEPWSEQMRSELELRLGIIATDNYGLSEVMGPGVAGDCFHKCGMHLAEDHFLAEIIDPETEKVLPDGSVGELVITSLTKQALPLVRYRTHDITRLICAPCECGRTMIRMEKPRGRSDDMLIIKGVNVYPSQVEEVLLQVDGCSPHYQLVVDSSSSVNSLEVQVEVSDRIFLNNMTKRCQLIEEIQKRLGAMLGIRVQVKLVEPFTIKRYEGKACHVLRRR